MNQEPQLAAILQAIVSAAGELDDCLEREHGRLLAGDARALAALLAEKEALVARLGQLDQQRQGLMGERAMAEVGAEQPQLGQLWEQARSRLAQCRQHNERNGRVIHSGRRHLDRVLDLLGAGGDATYNARGHTAPRGGGSRIISKA